MKNQKWVILLSSILFIVFIPFVKANPVVGTFEPKNVVIYVLTLGGLFITSASIELVIIMMFIRKNRLYQNYNIFYKSVLTANLGTFIITQIVAFLTLMYSPSNIFLYIIIYVLIESIPISLEYLIYIKTYKFLNQSNSFRNPIDNRKTFLSTITANLATFLFGALLSFIFPQII
ncbi:MAG: hypothetical protein ACFE9Z_10985 [Promethearchaeota archaeon]